jgi:hypothetical protein
MKRYILLVPVNLLRLALPITQCLTYVPAALLALDALDRGQSSMDQENVKLLLSYFVVLGLIQFTESLIPGVLERKIREYSIATNETALTISSILDRQARFPRLPHPPPDQGTSSECVLKRD